MSVPSVEEVLRYWYERQKDPTPVRLFIDIGEPTCWACDYFWWGRHDVGSSAATWSECVKAWKAAPLQRCHIVPSSLGGTDDPSNIFLMCAECHDLAPCTSVPDVFFKWVEKQSFYNRESAIFKRSLEDFGIDIEDESVMRELVDLMQSQAFLDWSKDKIGIHRAQGPPFGPRVTRASYIGILVQYWRQSKPT
jgi:hypothetical protein